MSEKSSTALSIEAVKIFDTTIARLTARALGVEHGLRNLQNTGDEFVPPLHTALPPTEPGKETTKPTQGFSK